MKNRIEYAEGTYRERVTCEGCGGKGTVRPALFGEREAPDGREAEGCEACDGKGYTVLELHGADAEEAAMHVGILTSSGVRAVVFAGSSWGGRRAARPRAEAAVMSALAYLVVFSTGGYEDVLETVLGVFLDAADAELFANASRADLVGWDRVTLRKATYERRLWRGLNVDYTGADIEVRTAPLNPARPGVAP